VAYKSRDMRRRLVTPEGVDLGVVLGEVGQRVSAFMLDSLVLIGALVAMTLIALFGVFGVGQAAFQPIVILWLLGFFVLRNFYFIIMEMRPRAATLGKRWSGLRVVARDGGRLTGDAVIARNLMREIEVFLPLSLLAGGGASGTVDGYTTLFGLGWTGIFLLFPFFNADRLRVGDLLAGTWVIQTRPKKLVVDLSVARTSAFTFTPAQLGAYGVYELDTLDNVIRNSDGPARSMVAQTIIDRIHWTSDVTDIDGFLTAYYTQLRAHLESGLLLGRRRESKHDASLSATNNSFSFTAAQLSVYGELEYEKLGEVLRMNDASARLRVVQAIINKIGWENDVTDIDGFLKSYYAALRERYERGMLAGVANGSNRR
jgi:uncharacterized RDD family membrane protein YckC